jgi:anti-sigma factor RsiW
VTDDKTVSEEMLHAYVDGVLTPEEAARVDAWLANHPDDAAAVAAWRHQNALIRDVFGAPEMSDAESEPVAVEQPPESEDPAGRPRRARSPWRVALAASIAAFIVGVTAGVGLGIYVPGMRPESSAIAEQAKTAYRVYSVEKRHPVEVGPDEREHLVTWLSNRLEAPLALPDLAGQGLELVGGRLTAGERGPAALFMFEASNGDRFTVYVTRPARSAETAFRFDLSGDVGTCYWLGRDLAVVVNGPADRDRLQAVAEQVYDAYEAVAPVSQSSKVMP